jgi:O-glycosyl hydrolase
MANRYIRIFLPAILAAGPAFAQPETMAWGNITGIRVDGQLMELNSSLCVAHPDWTRVTRTGQERQQSSYARSGKVETVKLQMQPGRAPAPAGWTVSATQTVEDAGAGVARVNLEYSAPSGADIAGAYLCLDLPAAHYSAGAVELIEPEAGYPTKIALAPRVPEQNEYVRTKASGARFVAPKRQLDIRFNEPTEVIVRDDRSAGSYNLQVYLGVLAGKAEAGATAKRAFTIAATGEVDRAPVEIAVDAARPGQLFEGLGGNFRIQNARTDPPVIQYNLDNLRLAWGRVEMPWQLWHPVEEEDPLAAARAGKTNPRVDAAMGMARTLSRKGMPVIVSAWQAPAWAVLGGGGQRRPLNPEKLARIRESLAGYLVHLKEKYGVEAAMFSFNESDIGINVLQSPREHTELIRTLGPLLASKGLATTLLLGDTSDARPVGYIKMAMQDPEAMKFVGAVSFHSWRGCTDEILAQWRDAARALNVPLLVGEGSTDAAAHRYNRIFLEQSFALHEINLYTRILAMAQPKSILQWQLTADYSILVGGGVLGDDGPLRPTQRFWNLKQLASTPERSFHLPVACEKPGLACAGFGNIAEGKYAVHVVNTAAGRPATITGLPAGIQELRTWVTDSRRGMQEGPRVAVREGKAELQLDPTSFTTVMGVVGESRGSGD